MNQDRGADSISPGSWLVTGGAGYIGAHVVSQLFDQGVEPVVLDSLDTGFMERLPESVDVRVGRVADASRILGDVQAGTFQGVVHLAGLKNARESMEDPLRYWKNNLGELIPLLQWTVAQGIPNFIFSSSSSLYGHQAGVTETSHVQPVSPYGNSKLAAERLLNDVANRYPLNVCSLRYFNVIGCGNYTRSQDTGFDNVVPRFVGALASGQSMHIYGTDLATGDGTCVRDYVDVRDLARAHGLVAERMIQGLDVPTVINVSTGKPASVLQIAHEVARAMNVENPPIIGSAAHPADPSEVWAQVSPTLESWDWSPQYSLAESIESHVLASRSSVGQARG